MAVITALLAVNTDTRVNIYTDNATVVSLINNNTPIPILSTRKLCKIENLDLYNIIQKLTLVKNISLSVQKIKAHSNIELNETADSLAKQGRGQPRCTLVKYLESNIIKPTWNTYTIQCSARKFENHKNKTIRWLQFFESTRIQNIPNAETYNWTLATDIIRNYPDKKWNETTYKDNKKRSTRLKILFKELPVKETLYQRAPNLYLNNLCPCCQLLPETVEHLLTCSTQQNRLENLLKQSYTLLQNGINDITKNKRASLPQELTNIFMPELYKDEIYLQNNYNILQLIIGLFPKNTIKHIQQFAPYNKVEKLLKHISNKTLKLFNQQIWLPRNEKMLKEEHTLNITPVMKKTRKYWRKHNTNPNINSNSHHNNNKLIKKKKKRLIEDLLVKEYNTNNTIKLNNIDISIIINTT
jgi:hypothetical protein